MIFKAELLADSGSAAAASEFFRSATYLRAENVTHTLLVRNLLAIPVVVRNIPGTDSFDATSPYGYPGATMVSANMFHQRIDFSTTGLVSVFIRDRINGAALPGGTARGTVLLHDPTKQRTIRSTVMNTVRANERAGFQVRSVPGPDVDSKLLTEFTTVYYQNMRRVRAAPRYFFPPGYVRACLDFDRSWLVVVTAPDRQFAGGALCVISDQCIHYFLSATAERYQRSSPIKNGLISLLDMADDLSIPLNLGGGLAPGDGLERFKRGFSNAAAAYFTHEIVCDEAAFNQLACPRDAGTFFPPYRASA